MSDPRVIDARELRCPQPIIELARAARGASTGEVLVVWWTDPAAEYDIPAWARMRGHQVVGTAPLDVDGTPGHPAYATTVRIGQA